MIVSGFTVHAFSLSFLILFVASFLAQLLPFSEKKVLQQNQCDDVP